MKLKELLNGLDLLEIQADLELDITGVCYDSRQVRPGDLFVAIAGFAADGHKFIPKALADGAAAVLCQEPTVMGNFVRIADTRLGLALVSANWFGHPADRMTMIGITGTNGKTTSTYLLKHVLETALGAKVGLVGTIQNMIGDEVIHTERTTPESYDLQALFRRMLDAGCTHVIMEVSSHALSLHRVGGVRFQTGVFSNLTQDHLDFHHTMEEYRKAKSLLFSICDHGVINVDDPAGVAMIPEAKCPIVTYSAAGNRADLTAEHIGLHQTRVDFDATYENWTAPAMVNIPGGFSVYNALSVIGAALTLGLTLPEITEALSTAQGVKGRAEVVPTPGKDYTVIIDYSHTPDSLENILKTARAFCKGRLIAVFGCGGDRDPIKRPIMGRIAGQFADFAVVTSDNPRTEDPMKIIDQILPGVQETGTPFTVIENRRQAIRWAMDNAGPGDVIILAGKGHETYQEIGHEKFHLDEREEVAAHLMGN